MPVSQAKVLVVEDERGLADLFSTWLEPDYEVRKAYGGKRALEIVDSDTDVVLLDRRMPDLSGDEVLDEIRSRELGCHVAMVTAVEPDFDIVEMGFDDYVIKPVTKDELHELVERMLTLEDIGPGAKQYYSRVSKKSALEKQKDTASLESNPQVEELNQGIETYDSMVVSLAEEALSDKKNELMTLDRKTPTGELRKWEDKLDALDESDPLYQVARQRIEELQADKTSDVSNAQVPFLETVAEGFVAEGLWLEPPVRRALNLILYEKDSEQFIINRKALTTIAEEDAAAKFDVSQEIRDLARRELQELA